MDGVLGGVVLAGVVEDESDVTHESARIVVLHRVQRFRHRPERSREKHQPTHNLYQKQVSFRYYCFGMKKHEVVCTWGTH